MPNFVQPCTIEQGCYNLAINGVDVHFSVCLDYIDTMMWMRLSICGAPPPARLDHAMCSIRIPVLSTHTDITKGKDSGITRGIEVRGKEVESAQGNSHVA